MSQSRIGCFTSQSPVVAPVAACVRCSNVLSVSSLTPGSFIRISVSSKISSLAGPEIHIVNIDLMKNQFYWKSHRHTSVRWDFECDSGFRSVTKIQKKNKAFKVQY